jgi:hypothetical protein
MAWKSADFVKKADVSAYQYSSTRFDVVHILHRGFPFLPSSLNVYTLILPRISV